MTPFIATEPTASPPEPRRMEDPGPLLGGLLILNRPEEARGHSLQDGDHPHGQATSPAARRSASAASSEMAYRSPALFASGRMSGWNTVAFGAAKSDRFELTSTRERG